MKSKKVYIRVRPSFATQCFHSLPNTVNREKKPKSAYKKRTRHAEQVVYDNPDDSDDVEHARVTEPLISRGCKSAKHDSKVRDLRIKEKSGQPLAKAEQTVLEKVRLRSKLAMRAQKARVTKLATDLVAAQAKLLIKEEKEEKWEAKL